MAGIMFSDNGMYVSNFHGAAVLEIDWKAGIDNEKSEGAGFSSANGFKIGKRTTHGIVTSIDAYALSENYELVEGEWAFQLWYGDEILAEQKFTAYWPTE
jgi:hypothetical protein